ncbi:unnamed protein product [Caenorhabditis angaria]|uniref:Actin maturation protease n=1 Tax=Caenorhabditis angaria TaxID=860376 RepID=A0A9P1ITW0_9PELO|nr:unnamed protein product [Caenorhabditis angaria]
METISDIPPITQSKLSDYGSNSRFIFDKNVKPELQIGPKCGLVALSMSLKSKGIDCNVDEIFGIAKELNYTIQGEMFSAYSLSEVANKISPGCSKVEEFPGASELSQRLLNGQHILVAYDCDKNFSATKHNGHKAHWLLMCGFLDKSSGEKEGSMSPVQNPEDLIILGYQGKSRYLGFFPYTAIFESNAQLFEAGPIRLSDEYNLEDFVNLRNKIVSINI